MRKDLTLNFLDGPEVVILALKNIQCSHAFLAFGLRRSHTRFNKDTPIIFCGFTTFFLTEVRARNARKIFGLKNTRLKKNIRLLRCELER